MVNYADYQWYMCKYLQGREAAVPTSAFAYYARLATQEIKRFTGDNVNECEISEEVKMCCCEVAELVYDHEQKNAQNGVSSESVGGWSRSYESTENRNQIFGTAVRDCVYKWLSGTGLLYRGVR